MSAELIAIACLFAFTVGSSVVSFFTFRKVKQEIYSFGDQLLEGFGDLFTTPTVKKAFSILGKQGGEAKAESGLVEKMALDVIDGPQFAAIKLAASGLGFDLDGYIEEHGALKTLQAAKQLGSILGIDITNIDLSSLGSLAGPGKSGGGNPYFGR